jgi:hypothetical protein
MHFVSEVSDWICKIHSYFSQYNWQQVMTL